MTLFTDPEQQIPEAARLQKPRFRLLQFRSHPSHNTSRLHVPQPGPHAMTDRAATFCVTV